MSKTVHDNKDEFFNEVLLIKEDKRFYMKILKFQIGAKPGHMPQEHIFVFRSVLELYSDSNIPLIIQTFDISRYFDRHTLLEAMHWLEDASVPSKCYRLVWKLNENTTVRVKTAHGISDTAITGENLGQGSRSAGMICSVSLSKSSSKYFEGCQHEVSYGSVQLSTMLFQDDGLRLTTSIEGARDGYKRFEKIMDSKRLDLNVDKSVFLLAGKRNNVERIQREIESDPLLYKGSKVKEKLSEKWLGDFINGAGVKESTLPTIRERKFRIMCIINETFSIIEDSRMHKLNGMQW